MNTRGWYQRVFTAHWASHIYSVWGIVTVLDTVCWAANPAGVSPLSGIFSKGGIFSRKSVDVGWGYGRSVGTRRILANDCVDVRVRPSDSYVSAMSPSPWHCRPLYLHSALSLLRCLFRNFPWLTTGKSLDSWPLAKSHVFIPWPGIPCMGRTAVHLACGCVRVARGPNYESMTDIASVF